MPSLLTTPTLDLDSDDGGRAIWEAALAHLELQTSPAQFKTYLRDTFGLAYDPGASVLRVGVANPFHIPWLEGRFSSPVHAAVAQLLDGAPVRVEFVARSQATATEVTDHRKPLPVRPLDMLLEGEASSAGPAATRATAPVEDGQTAPKRHQGSPLNPRYTFSSFVVGMSNQLAHAASLAVADEPGRAYNPLFLYGGVGLGKTHLLHAIGHAVLAGGRSVVYVSSETFTNELIESIRQHRTDEFRAKYRRAKLLLVDDVQFIAGKERTEEEFFHTFNAVHEAGGQIVLSSDRPPRAMPILEDRLRSRFEWGLIADVQPPDFETRIAILRSKLTMGEAGVPPEVIEFIAHKVQSNIRELEGSLNRLLAYARHLKQPVTVDLAATALRDLVAPGPSSINATPAAILTAVSRYYGVSEEDLKGRSRHKEIVVPRQVAMFVMREDARLSTPEIGRVLNRDHTTILHGVNLVASDIARDGPCRAAVRGVRDVLHGSQTSAGGTRA